MVMHTIGRTAENAAKVSMNLTALVPLAHISAYTLQNGDLNQYWYSQATIEAIAGIAHTICSKGARHVDLTMITEKTTEGRAFPKDDENRRSSTCAVP